MFRNIIRSGQSNASLMKLSKYAVSDTLVSRLGQLRLFSDKSKAPRAPSQTVTAVYKLNPALAQVVGAEEATRAGMIKGVWAYIKNKGLQNDPLNKGVIVPDALIRSLKPEIDSVLTSKDVMGLLTNNYDKTPIRELGEAELTQLYPDKNYEEYFQWARENPEEVAARKAKAEARRRSS